MASFYQQQLDDPQPTTSYSTAVPDRYQEARMQQAVQDSLNFAKMKELDDMEKEAQLHYGGPLRQVQYDVITHTPQMSPVTERQKELWAKHDDHGRAIGEDGPSGLSPAMERVSQGLDYVLFGSNSEKFDDWEENHYNDLGTLGMIGEMAGYMIPGVDVGLDVRDWSLGRVPGVLDYLGYVAYPAQALAGLKKINRINNIRKKAGSIRDTKRRIDQAKKWIKADNAAKYYNPVAPQYRDIDPAALMQGPIEF